MSEHQIIANFQGNIEIDRTDLKVVVKKNGLVFGTLTLSRGSIDWRPKKKHIGGKNEIKLSWTKFDEKIRE
jgi:DNA topoisomerase VI subunit A